MLRRARIKVFGLVMRAQFVTAMLMVTILAGGQSPAFAQNAKPSEAGTTPSSPTSPLSLPDPGSFPDRQGQTTPPELLPNDQPATKPNPEAFSGKRDLAPAQPAGQELVELRTSTSKTFVGDNPGERRTEVYGAPVHYQNPQGHWIDLDTDLAPSKNGRRHQVSNGLDVSLADSGNDAGLADIVLDGSHSVGFSLEGAAKVTGKTDGKSVTYRKLRKDTDVRITSQANGVKEELVLSSPAAPDRFVFPLRLRNLTASIDERGDVVYRDPSGTARARTPHGFMTDANVDALSNEAPMSLGVSYALIPNGKGIALEVRLDRAWLNDPARVWPVTVDPSIAAAAGSDDTYVMTGVPTDSASETLLKVGSYDGGAHIARAFMHFDSTAFAGATVTHAELHLAERWSYNCAYQPEPVYIVRGAWNGHSIINWSDQPPADAGATALGGFANSGCNNRLAVWDVTSAAGSWAATPGSNFGLSLRASNESDSNRWKKYASTEDGAPPALIVTYNRPPVIPYGVTPAYNASDPRQFTSTTTTSAYYADPDGGSGQLAFGLWNQGNQLVWSAWGPSVCSGCRSSVAIPAQPDGWYYVRAIGWDGQGYSSDFSPPNQWFFIDTRAPLMPSEVTPAAETLVGPNGLVSARYGEPYNWPGYVLFRAVEAGGQIFDSWSTPTCGGCMASANLPLVHGAVYTLYTIAWDIGLVSAWSPTQSFAFMPMETTFDLNAPVPLTQVVDALRPLGRHPVSFIHTGAREGGHVTQGLTVDQAAATYREQYATVLSGEPQVASFTVEGQIQTAAVGSLSQSVIQRREVDPVGTRTMPAASTAAAAADETPFPAFGQTLTTDFPAGRRKILNDMTWDTQASINAFGGEAYEHNFVLFNRSLSGRVRPFCHSGEENEFWAKRSGATLLTNFPKAAKPYIDTDFADTCQEQDLTVGLYHPTRLLPGVLYRTELIVNTGTKTNSPYELTATKVEKACDFNVFCVGTNNLDDDPDDLLVGEARGLAPGCRSWGKGEVESTPCGTLPPLDPNNRRPTVDAGPPASGPVRTDIALAGSGSDPDGDLVLMSWTYIPGPGVDPAARCLFNPPAQGAAMVNCTHSGIYTVTLQGTDALSPPVTDSTTLTVTG